MFFNQTIKSTKRLNASLQRLILNESSRSASTCIHIKGLPAALPTKRIYDFFRSYGKVTQFTTFNEAPKYTLNGNINMHELRKDQKKNHISHNRLPGQTAIIKFESSSSAIMAKEELHWRPFPIIGVDENQQDILRPLLNKDIHKNPRDRPILNILFETSHLKTRLRSWVQSSLHNSSKQIGEWEKETNASRSEVKSKKMRKKNDNNDEGNN